MCLGEEPPSELARTIRLGGRQRLHSSPTGLLQVKVNGRRTYFEWINAGRYVCQGTRGAMNQAATGLVSDLYFGFDTERLFLRLDAVRGPVRERLAEVARLRVTFFQPEGFQVIVSDPAQRSPRVELLDRGVAVAGPGIEAAGDAIFEMSIPFRTLGVATDNPIQFAVELLEDDQSIERTATEKDVIEMDDRGGPLCELIDGTLVEKTMGVYESWLAAGSLALLACLLKSIT